MKRLIMALICLFSLNISYADYDGPGSQSYTNRQQEQWWQAQQQANANATARGWGSPYSNCGSNGCY